MKISQRMSKLWQEAYLRYEFQKNKVNQKIQASLSRQRQYTHNLLKEIVFLIK